MSSLDPAAFIGDMMPCMPSWQKGPRSCIGSNVAVARFGCKVSRLMMAECSSFHDAQRFRYACTH
jgi:hypothetical protein